MLSRCVYFKSHFSSKVSYIFSREELNIQRGSNVRKHMLLMFKIIRAETSIIAFKGQVNVVTYSWIDFNSRCRHDTDTR